MRPTVIEPPASRVLCPGPMPNRCLTSSWASIVNLPKEGLKGMESEEVAHGRAGI